MLWKRCNKSRTFRSVITNVFIMLVYTLSCSVNGGLVSVLVLSVQSRLALSHSLLNSEPVPEPPLTPGGGSGAINHLLIKEPYRTASHIRAVIHIFSGSLMDTFKPRLMGVVSLRRTAWSSSRKLANIQWAPNENRVVLISDLLSDHVSYWALLICSSL